MKYYQYALSLTILASGFADTLRLIRVGGITTLGIMTLVLAPISWFLVFSRYRLPKAVLTAFALVLFLVYGLVDWVWHYSTLPFAGVIQNISVYIAFVGLLVLSTVQSSRIVDTPEYISRNFPKAIKISLGLYSVNLLLAGPGASVFMGARSFGLFAIIAIAWYLAAWRYRLNKSLWWAGYILVAIALSNSRTALLIGLILFTLSQVSFTSFKSLMRMLLTIFLIITVSVLAFTFVKPVRDRFTAVGDNATVAGVKINTSGRNAAWPVAFASAMESPWIGKGPGSVAVVLGKRVGSAFIHPHNDYLRIFHDFGLIGLTIFIFGYGQLIVKTWQNWQWADKNDIKNAPIHLAAFLSLIAVSLAMLSDNVVIYIFVMSPLGVLVGASLGNASSRKKIIKSTHKFTLNSSGLEQLPIQPEVYSSF